MAVYVDAAIWKWVGHRWCHLLADDEWELHRFASQLGLKRSSYQGPPRTSAPHYDITGFERDRAVRLGAVQCSREEIVEVFRRVKVRDFRRRGQGARSIASAGSSATTPQEGTCAKTSNAKPATASAASVQPATDSTSTGS